MKAVLRKRRRWRPRDANGNVIPGGAGGFHFPQIGASYLTVPARKRTKPGPREWGKNWQRRDAIARRERQERRAA